MKRIWNSVSALAITAVLLPAGIAHAQAAAAPDEATTVEEILVTGSRIRTSPLERTQPVVEIDQDVIEKTGITSTADLLQRIPSAGGGLNSKFNNSGNFGNPPDGGGVGAGAAEIDLRYLSSRRVLVLVDGLRWVPGSSASGVPGAVDLNTIPPSMIQRVEVLQEGASPIYGSDAIAGVVNIITKDRQDGLQASAQVGGFGEGDGFSQDYQMSWGLTQDRTRIVVGGNYFKAEPVFSADRDISRFPNPYATSCLEGGCSSGTLDGRVIVRDFRQPDPGAEDAFLDITLKSALQPGQVPVFDPLNPTGPGSSYRGFETLDRFNFQPYNYIVTPSERLGAWGQLTHEFSDNLYVRLRGSYAKRKSANQAGPLPLFVGPDAGNGNLLDTVTIDATNPYNPFGFTLEPGTYSFVGRRLIEGGPRHYEQEVDTWNFTATIGGELNVMNRTWYWDANAVISENDAHQTFTGNVNAQRVQDALGPLSECTGSCVPLNIFGGRGTITQAMLDYISFTQQDSSGQELQDFTFNLTGDLFDLPAGPFAFAAGVEHRHNEGFFEPDAIVAAGLSSDIPAQPAQGEIDVTEAYLELRAPIIADVPGFYRLEASAAGRWFDYSTSGSDSTYKLGLLWRPVQEVLLRGSWGQGYRGPSIGELYGSASRFDQEIVDPCSDFLTNGSSATVRANCIAQGVPANGSYTQLNPQISVITSGNPALVPETSKSWNVSGVWEPSFMKDSGWASRGFVELVYSDIKVDNAIQALNGQALLDRCANLADALACATITRTASGQVTAITNPLINIGGIKTRSIDLNMVWASPETDLGRFQLRSYATFLLEFTEYVPSSTGLVPVEREGTERGSPDQAYPKTKWNLMADWDKGDFGATVALRYLSAVDETGGSNTLDSRTYIDAQLRWTPPVMNDQFRIAIGANNLFNQDPPGCISCGLNNYDPNAYDAPGRYFYLRLTYRQ
jgi:iron complex outermembrane recepter protein